MRTGIFTLLTLGFYRFWMKTRLRRWYWSSIRPGGDPLEYTGQPIEKLIGFLIAVCILAFYLAIINLLLMFASYALFSSNVIAYLASFAGVVPVLFYARYRARRYVLARTRWRAVRFGLDKGAWRYSAVALWQWVTVIVSLGLLWPRKTFRLEKFITDRTAFGSVKLRQNGKWQILLPAAAHLFIGVSFTLFTILAAVEMSWETDDPNDVPFLNLLFLTIPYAIFGLVYYNVEAMRILANHKTAGGIGLVARPRVARILRINILGYLGIALVILPVLVVLGFSIAAISSLDLFNMSGQEEGPISTIWRLPSWILTAMTVLLYFAVFLLWFVLRHALITMPVIRHYAETLTLTGAHTLPEVSQKARDDFAEAEGFAEALDLGAAI